MIDDHMSILLLDYLCEMPSQFKFLFSGDAELIFNKPRHGLNESGLCDRLEFLVAEGLIYVAGEGVAVNFHDKLISPNAVFGLTKKGGEVWESAFKPRWENYISDESKLIENNKSKICFGSLSSRTLKTFISSLGLPAESLVCQDNWHAFYWKVFPRGFTYSFISVDGAYEGEIAKNKPNWKRTYGRNSHKDSGL